MKAFFNFFYFSMKVLRDFVFSFDNIVAFFKLLPNKFSSIGIHIV